MDRTGGTGLDDRVWKNISIVLGVVCALLLGVAGALMIVGHRSPAPAASSGPTIEVATESTGTAGPTDTSGGTPSQGPPITTGPTGTPGPVAPATVTFTGITLDAASDTNGTTRTFTFRSDGGGPVPIAVTKISSGGTAKLCVSADGAAFACMVGTPSKLPGFPKASADTAHSDWTIALIGYGPSTPTVDLTFTWPTGSPRVMFAHGRLQATPEGLNGFTVAFKPRASGTLNVQSAWSPGTYDVNMSLYDVTTSPAVAIEGAQRDYKGVTYISPAYTAEVGPSKSYQVKFRRTSGDTSERPDLTVQITFP
jgi:hypothetical protein